MELVGLQIVASEGLFSDDWCEPEVRLTVRVEAATNEVRLAAWVKPEEDMPSALFIVAASTSASTADFARLGELKEFALPVALAAGESVDLRVRTRHRAANVLPDTRDLSFLLVRLSAH